MRSSVFRVAIATLLVGGIAGAIVTSRFAFLAVALVAGFLLATSFSEAARVAGELQRLRNQSVEVLVWATPLSGTEGGTLTIASIKAVGAGLHFYFQVGSGGSPKHLKIAQPSRIRIEPQSITIGSARYVQWSGRKLQRLNDAPALVITVQDPR